MMSRRQKVAIAAGILGVCLLLIVSLKFAGALTVLNVGPVGAVVVVGLLVRRASRRRTETIFNFYVTANEIFGADATSRYRFEIAEAIKAGEKVVRLLPDPPPLSSFALG